MVLQALNMIEINNLQIQGHYVDKRTNDLVRIESYCSMFNDLNGTWYDGIICIQVMPSIGTKCVYSVEYFIENFKNA